MVVGRHRLVEDSRRRGWDPGTLHDLLCVRLGGLQPCRCPGWPERRDAP